ncbi:hypothetical protein FPV67DRAFT_1776340 [Lyophyllum atratum]|nr:hypothetical protein FPV67DRAFT_1776340 [Lyophyllum atratum]
MFSKLSLLALVTPLVAGLTLTISDKVTSGGQVTVSWTTGPGDPCVHTSFVLTVRRLTQHFSLERRATFSLELKNEVFHNAFAIANNVIPESGSIDITLPIVPAGDGYTLEAVDIGNINNVYASTGGFAVQDISSSTVSTSGATTGTGSATSGGSTVSVPPNTAPTTTATFGTTRTNPPSSAPTGSAHTSGSASGGFPAATSNAAVSALKMNTNVGAIAAVLLSAVAGAAIVL